MTPEQKYWKIVHRIYDMSRNFAFHKEDGHLELSRFGFKYGSAYVDVYLGSPRWQTWIDVYYSMDESSWMFWIKDVDEEMIRLMINAFSHCFLENIVKDIDN